MVEHDRKDPVEADQKVRFLMTHNAPRRVLGHAPTQSDFAERLGIRRETLRDQIYRNVLPPETQTILANKLHFRLDWPEWSNGTADDFESRYLKVHRTIPATINNVLLKKGPPKAPERCKVKGLAAIELFPAQVGHGSAAVGFELSCGKAFLYGVPVTIRVGEVAWDCGGGQLDPATRQGRAAPYQIGTVRFQWNGADTFQPAWRIDTDGTSIGDVDVSPDFGRVIGLAPGNTITITFGVWRPDIEEDDLADSNALVAAFDAISIPLDTGRADNPSSLSVAKKRILMRLATDALERHGDFIVLTKHAVTFVADQQDT